MFMAGESRKMLWGNIIGWNLLGMTPPPAERHSAKRSITAHCPPQCRLALEGKQVPLRLKTPGAAAANEMNNLQPIRVHQMGRRPLITRGNFAIQLDRHPVGFHTQLFDECGKT